MKNISIILGLVAALVIGGGAGYFTAKGSANTDIAPEKKKLEESITMMKEQSSTIQKMSEMMRSGGVMLQDMGMKYNDEQATMKGKDLEAVASKYLDENKKLEGSGSMKQIMDK